MTDLTDRQQAILDFVAVQIETHNLPPTLAEIAAAFGFKQTRGAHKHLLALETKGHLTLLPGKARGIRLKARARGRRSDAALSLPILGRVAAGAPIGADADIEHYLLLDRAMFFPTPDYLLKVKGDSMIDDGIFDGDLIAVHRTNVAENGQIVVARIDGEITVKRFNRGSRSRHPAYRDDRTECRATSASLHVEQQITLLPRNPDYAPIVVAPDADFAIEGLYCGLVRSA